MCIRDRENVDFPTYEKLDIRVGRVLECEKVKKADKLLRFLIDDGMEKRTIVSGIAKHLSLIHIFMFGGRLGSRGCHRRPGQCRNHDHRLQFGGGNNGLRPGCRRNRRLPKRGKGCHYKLSDRLLIHR